ncbi:MAG: CDP-glycerol glycerophosphotransferase family protein [Bacillota bacterium]
MSLSLVYLPGSIPLDRFEQQISVFPQDKVGAEFTQFFFLGEDVLASSKTGDQTVIKKKLKLEEITSEFIMFVDKDVTFNANFLDSITLEISSSDEFEFFQLTNNEKALVDNNLDVIHGDFEEITSLKIIRKSVLQKFGFINLENVDKIMLVNLYFELFKNGLPFKAISNEHIKQIQERTIDSIKLDGMALDQLLLSKSEADQRILKILFKKALVGKLFKLVDNHKFADLLAFEDQEVILNVFREVLKDVDAPALKTWNFSGYIPFTDMVREGLFTEALYYIRILRGKRYWYNTTKELEGKIKDYPIEETLSWKITKPLRKREKWEQKLNNLLVKWGLNILSFPVLIYFFGREVWLISERSDQAEDNGYAFFKYCREHYPNKKVYYIINQDSPHVDKVRKLGNVVFHSSLKHWVYLLIAKKYISAWVFEEFSYPQGKTNFKKIFKKQIKKKQQITLQHGVIIHNIAPYLNKKQYNQNLFISSSFAEKEVIKNTLGYEDMDVAVTGLARFDNLHDLHVKKQILIMPTWRRSLFNLNKNEFLLSEYFNRYYHLVRNKQLLDLIEREGITVVFYVHNQMQQFINEFVFEHPNIKFRTKEDAVVSDLLKESALLITDYSSVMADFLYMEKPILLYQFDPYNNHHGPVKEISYSQFGKIINEEDSLVNKIEEIVSRNFAISGKYLDNSNKFFAFKDTKNSERIFQAIENL